MQELISALSGLGMFLFGMTYMENAIKEAAGKNFKTIIKNSTDTIFKSIISGIISTAILQSSSVVSLMVLSFVGAGIMALSSGIGVIFGANIGTTVTVWIVAIIGFKIKIEAFALPIIGIGGILLMFFQDSKKIASIARIFVGFGLLFLGLDYMKQGTEHFASQFDLKDYLNYGAIVYVLIGIAITALVQASAATAAIALSALGSGIITFEVAAAITIGANIGTTATAILGSIGGTPDKKRVAVAHLLFNITTGIVALLLINKLTYLILELFDLKHDLMTALAMFHTIFNLLGVLMLAIFIPKMSQLLLKLFCEKEKSITTYIHNVQIENSVAEASIEASKNELLMLFRNTIRFGLGVFNVSSSDDDIKNKKTTEIVITNKDLVEIDFKEEYGNIKTLEVRLISYINSLSQLELSSDDVKNIEKIQFSIRELGFALKSLKDIKSNIDEFATDDNKITTEFYERFRKRYVKLSKYILRIFDGDTTKVDKLHELYARISTENNATLNEIANAIKSNNLNEALASSIMNVSRSVFEISNSIVDTTKMMFLVEQQTKENETINQTEQVKTDL